MSPADVAARQPPAADLREIAKRQTPWLTQLASNRQLTFGPSCDEGHDLMVIPRNIYRSARVPYAPGVGVVYSREMLKNEIVIECDAKDGETQLFVAKKLWNHCTRDQIPFEAGWTGGKSIHFHIFFDPAQCLRICSKLTHDEVDSIDPFMIARQRFFDNIIEATGLGGAEYNIDQTLLVASKGKGHVIREFGCPYAPQPPEGSKEPGRWSGNYKSYLDACPTEQNFVNSSASVALPPALRFCNFTGDFSKHYPTQIGELVTEAYQTGGVRPPAAPGEAPATTARYDGALAQTPDYKRIMSGLTTGLREEGCLVICSMCYKAGLTREEASIVVEEYIASCIDLDPDRRRGFRQKVNYVYNKSLQPGFKKLDKAFGGPPEGSPRAKKKKGAEHGEEDEKRKLCDQLVDLAVDNGLELHNDELGTSYASFNIGGHRELWPVRSDRFDKYLRMLYFEDTEQGISKDAVRDAIDNLDARAIFRGSRISPQLRVAEYNGSFYYFVGGADWRVIRIHPDIVPNGWEFCENPPMIFRMEEDMLPSVEPVPAANADAYWKVINLPADEGERVMMKAHIGTFFVPKLARAIMALFGRKGCCKSDAAGYTKAVVDPAGGTKANVDGDIKNLNVVFNEHHLCFFDNLSAIDQNVANMFCRVVDGESHQERRLYSNNGQVRSKFQRAIIITGVEPIGTEYTDLAQRSIYYQLPFVDESHRKTKRELDKMFDGCKAETLGYFLTILSKAMRTHEGMKEDDLRPLPRLADFCMWGEAISRAMGNADGVFTKAYFANQHLGVEESLEQNSLGMTIVGIWEENEYQGGYAAPAEYLFRTLKDVAAARQINTDGREFPKAPNMIGKKLPSIVEDLRVVGILYEKKAANKLDNKERKMLLDATGITVSEAEVLSKEARANKQIARATAIHIIRKYDPTVKRSAPAEDTAPKEEESAPKEEESAQAALYEEIVRNTKLRGFEVEARGPIFKEHLRVLKEKGRVAEDTSGYLFIRK